LRQEQHLMFGHSEPHPRPHGRKAGNRTPCQGSAAAPRRRPLQCQSRTALIDASEIRAPNESRTTHPVDLLLDRAGKQASIVDQSSRPVQMPERTAARCRTRSDPASSRSAASVPLSRTNGGDESRGLAGYYSRSAPAMARSRSSRTCVRGAGRPGQSWVVIVPGWPGRRLERSLPCRRFRSSLLTRAGAGSGRDSA